MIHNIPSFCPNCGVNFWELIDQETWECLECHNKITIEIEMLANNHERD